MMYAFLDSYLWVFVVRPGFAGLREVVAVWHAGRLLSASFLLFSTFRTYDRSHLIRSGLGSLVEVVSLLSRIV